MVHAAVRGSGMSGLGSARPDPQVASPYPFRFATKAYHPGGTMSNRRIQDHLDWWDYILAKRGEGGLLGFWQRQVSAGKSADDDEHMARLLTSLVRRPVLVSTWRKFRARRGWVMSYALMGQLYYEKVGRWPQDSEPT